MLKFDRVIEGFAPEMKQTLQLHRQNDIILKEGVYLRAMKS